MITHFRQAIEETLPWLSSFGADPAGGMTRLLYSPEWLKPSSSLKKEWQQAGWKHVSMKWGIYTVA